MSKKPKAVRTGEKQRRYVAYVPRIMRSRGKLCHNSVPHTADMVPGVNGFQAWFEVKPPKKFKLCGCGWSAFRTSAPRRITNARL